MPNLTYKLCVLCGSSLRALLFKILIVEQQSSRHGKNPQKFSLRHRRPPSLSDIQQILPPVGLGLTSIHKKVKGRCRISFHFCLSDTSRSEVEESAVGSTSVPCEH